MNWHLHGGHVMLMAVMAIVQLTAEVQHLDIAHSQHRPFHMQYLGHGQPYVHNVQPEVIHQPFQQHKEHDQNKPEVLHQALNHHHHKLDKPEVVHQALNHHHHKLDKPEVVHQLSPDYIQQHVLKPEAVHQLLSNYIQQHQQHVFKPEAVHQLLPYYFLQHQQQQQQQHVFQPEVVQQVSSNDQHHNAQAEVDVIQAIPHQTDYHHDGVDKSDILFQPLQYYRHHHQLLQQQHQHSNKQEVVQEGTLYYHQYAHKDKPEVVHEPHHYSPHEHEHKPEMDHHYHCGHHHENSSTKDHTKPATSPTAWLIGTKQVEFVLLIVVFTVVYIPEVIGLLSLVFPGGPAFPNDRRRKRSLEEEEEDMAQFLNSLDTIIDEQEQSSSPLVSARFLSLHALGRINTVLLLFLMLYYTMLLPGLIALLNVEFPGAPANSRS